MRATCHLSSGAIQGRKDGEIAVFRGIPYAALPHRFCAPDTVLSWDGARLCEEFGPAPPQPSDFGMDTGFSRGHEWLTVNVWTPDQSARLPVMVWVQGGAYTFGMSGLPEYDGAGLARRGVVVVTFNYRVGLEGFGLVPGAPANRGLLDQVAALEWVQLNIDKLGGDPGRVTVFGQSAGAGSIAALLVMPRASGLFTRAVVQSMPGTYFTPALAADVTTTCAAELGCGPAGLAMLDPYELPAAGVAVAARLEELAGRWGAAAHANVIFAPVVDGDVLPVPPWLGLTGDVDLLVGHTRHEQRLLSLITGRLGAVSTGLAELSADVFAPDPTGYRRAFPDPDELDDVVRSDWLFRMPSLKLADAQVAAGGTAYMYELAWSAPGMGGALGACHGLDVPLVFGNLSAGQTAMLLGEPDAVARAVSDDMQRAWVDFATTGDPGWPTHDTGLARVFDSTPATVKYPESVSAALWRDVIPRVCDLTPPVSS